MENIDLINIENKYLRGNEIVDFLDNYVVIDIETTGFDKDYDIIEISALRYENCELIDTFSQLVYSEKIETSSDSYKINKIHPDMVKNSPKIDEVLENFLKFLKEDDILVGHNILTFDINKINSKLKKINKCLKNDFVDTMNISKRFDDFNKNSLEYLAEKFGLKKQNHRSYDDCLLCNEVYHKLREKFQRDFESLESFQNKKMISNNKKNNNNPNCNNKLKIIFDENIDESIFFYNKNICLTGEIIFINENLPNHSGIIDRDELESYIKIKGGFVKGSVSKKTDYLIVGDLSKYGNKTAKLKRAVECGTEIINVDEFFKKISLNVEL